MPTISPTQQQQPAPRRVHAAQTVETKLKVNCGCGASFSEVFDGEDHARATGHTLHITGEIRAQR